MNTQINTAIYNSRNLEGLQNHYNPVLLPLIYNSRNLEGLQNTCERKNWMHIYNSRNLEGLQNIDFFGKVITSTIVEI